MAASRQRRGRLRTHWSRAWKALVLVELGGAIAVLGGGYLVDSLDAPRWVEGVLVVLLVAAVLGLALLRRRA